MAPATDMPAWTKSPAELQERFGKALDQFPNAERRQMFGYPAAFANGNMWTGLHQGNWVIRLPDAGLRELFAIQGAVPFEPVPGRPMTGFATLPPTVLGDPILLNAWLTRALGHALSMPPKAAKTPKAAKQRP